MACVEDAGMTGYYFGIFYIGGHKCLYSATDEVLDSTRKPRRDNTVSYLVSPFGLSFSLFFFFCLFSSASG